MWKTLGLPNFQCCVIGSSGGITTHTPDREPTTDQSNDGIQVQHGKPMSSYWGYCQEYVRNYYQEQE